MLFINYIHFFKTKQFFKLGDKIYPSPLINVMNNNLYPKRLKNGNIYNPIVTLCKDKKIVKFKPDKYYFVFVFLTVAFGIFYIKNKNVYYQYI